MASKTVFNRLVLLIIFLWSSLGLQTSRLRRRVLEAYEKVPFSAPKWKPLKCSPMISKD